MGHTKCAHGCVQKTQPFGFVPRLIWFIQPAYHAAIVNKILNKLRKDEVEKFTQVYFDLLKHLRNLLSFINSECQSRNTVMFASTSGKNLYKGRNNAVPLYIKFVCQQIMCIIFHLNMAFRIYIERKTIYRHSILNHIKSNPDTYIQINIIFFLNIQALVRCHWFFKRLQTFQIYFIIKNEQNS